MTRQLTLHGESIKVFIAEISNDVHPSNEEWYVVKYEDNKLVPSEYVRQIIKRIEWLRKEILKNSKISLHYLIPSQSDNYVRILFMIVQRGNGITLQNYDHVKFLDITSFGGYMQNHLIISDDDIAISPPKISDTFYSRYGVEIAKNELSWLIEVLNDKSTDRVSPSDYYGKEIKPVFSLPPTWTGNQRIGYDANNRLVADDFSNLLFLGSESKLVHLIGEFKDNFIILSRNPEIWSKTTGADVVVHAHRNIRFNLLGMYESHKELLYQLMQLWTTLSNANFRATTDFIEIMKAIVESGDISELSLQDLVLDDPEIEEMVWNDLSLGDRRQSLKANLSDIFNLPMFQEHAEVLQELLDGRVHVIDVSGLNSRLLMAFSTFMMIVHSKGLFGKKWIVIPEINQIVNASDNWNAINSFLKRINTSKMIMNVPDLHTALNKSFTFANWTEFFELIAIENVPLLPDRLRTNYNFIRLEGEIILHKAVRSPTAIKIQGQPGLLVDYKYDQDITKLLYILTPAQKDSTDDIQAEDFIEEEGVEKVLVETEEQISVFHKYTILSYLYGIYSPQNIKHIEKKLEISADDNLLRSLLFKELIEMVSYGEVEGYLLTSKGKNFIDSLKSQLTRSDYLISLENEANHHLEIITKLRLKVFEHNNFNAKVETIEDLILTIDQSKQDYNDIYHLLMGLLAAVKSDIDEPEAIIQSELQFILEKLQIKVSSAMNAELTTHDQEFIDEITVEEINIAIQDSETDEEFIIHDLLSSDHSKFRPVIPSSPALYKHWMHCECGESPSAIVTLDGIEPQEVRVYKYLENFKFMSVIPISYAENSLKDVHTVCNLGSRGLVTILDEGIQMTSLSPSERSQLRELYTEYGLNKLEIKSKDITIVKTEDLSVLSKVKSEPTKVLSLPSPNGKTNGNNDMSVLRDVKSEPTKISKLPSPSGKSNGNKTAIKSVSDNEIIPPQTAKTMTDTNYPSIEEIPLRNNLITKIVDGGYPDLRSLIEDPDRDSNLKAIKGIGHKTVEKINDFITQMYKTQLQKKSGPSEKISIPSPKLDLGDIILGKDQINTIRIELIEHLHEDPESVVIEFISQAIFAQVCGIDITTRDSSLIDDLNKIGSESGTNTSLFTSNLMTMTEMWDEQEERRENLISILISKLLLELSTFTFTQKFIEAAKSFDFS